MEMLFLACMPVCSGSPDTPIPLNMAAGARSDPLVTPRLGSVAWHEECLCATQFRCFDGVAHGSADGSAVGTNASRAAAFTHPGSFVQTAVSVEGLCSHAARAPPRCAAFHGESLSLAVDALLLGVQSFAAQFVGVCAASRCALCTGGGLHAACANVGATCANHGDYGGGLHAAWANAGDNGGGLHAVGANGGDRVGGGLRERNGSLSTRPRGNTRASYTRASLDGPPGAGTLDTAHDGDGDGSFDPARGGDASPNATLGGTGPTGGGVDGVGTQSLTSRRVRRVVECGSAVAFAALLRLWLGEGTATLIFLASVALHAAMPHPLAELDAILRRAAVSIDLATARLITQTQFGDSACRALVGSVERGSGSPDGDGL